MWWGQVAFYKFLTSTKLENSNADTKKKKKKMEAFLIFFHAIWWSFYAILAPSSELGSQLDTLHTPQHINKEVS